MACRFPGARDPAEFHDLAVAGRDMFQPVAALPGRPLRAAVLDDWSAPQIADHRGMRAAEEAGPSGPAPAGAVSCGGAGNPARSVT
jgi:hypothetical protein